MGKWINVDAVNIEIGGGYIDIDTESFLNAPSIDICFCHECKYTGGKPPIAGGRSWCERHNAFMYYCSEPSELFYYEEDRNGYGNMNEADTPQTERSE